MSRMRVVVGAFIVFGDFFQVHLDVFAFAMLPLVMWAQGNLHIQKGQAAEARDILLKAKEEAQALGHDASAVAVSAYLGIASGQLGDHP